MNKLKHMELNAAALLTNDMHPSEIKKESSLKWCRLSVSYVAARNTKGGSITVLLTSCLTGLE